MMRESDATSFRDTLFRAFSAFQFIDLMPGALPQAMTFRAFGAENRRCPLPALAVTMALVPRNHSKPF